MVVEETVVLIAELHVLRYVLDHAAEVVIKNVHQIVLEVALWHAAQTALLLVIKLVN